MNFCFATLGCKVNQFETQALAQLAQARGHCLTKKNADVCIINTCTVTSSGDKKTLQMIRHMQQDHPNAVIALCGCFSQTEPERAASIDGVDIICGTTDRAEILRLCEQAVTDRQPIHAVHEVMQCRSFEELPAGTLPGHTRALLKVQDGCDNYCTYCIIPYARGHIRSLPMQQAIAQAIRLADNGIREIMITGIEIASYGRDLVEKPTLVDLTEALCEAVPQVRFRLGSLEPRILTQTFCDRLRRFDNLALHFHVSLQSGCDATLKRMHRRYSTQQYWESIQRLREAFPACSITTDVITGFPGETQEEFEQTRMFLKKCAFASVHIFPYSERSGTPAASMPDSVPQHIRAQRADILRKEMLPIGQEFLRSFIGQTVSVIAEHGRTDCQPAHGKWHFTIQLPPDTAPQGSEISVRITAQRNQVLLAEPISL